jgi:L-histidine Nalpha-methyltransferase
MRHSVVSKTSTHVQQDRGFQPVGNPISLHEFAEDVRQGLSRSGQKELFSKYLYDDVGSSLFDVITVLPEYGLCRADARLLRKHSRSLAALADHPSMVIELGSGSGSKTRWILSEMAARQPITYCPIDISESALHRCCLELSTIDSVEIVPIAQSYLEGLQQALRMRPANTSVLILFLGSTIGNFDPGRAVGFLRSVRQELQPGDVLYLSTDLEKDTERMLAAYDDPIGATAAFNLNLLARINRDLGGTFVLSRFQHQARYNESERRIEMHLQSAIDQTVHIGSDLVVRLKQGETIWTESSYKFRCEDVRALAHSSGFDCEAQWIDEEWPFAQSVLRAI